MDCSVADAITTLLCESLECPVCLDPLIVSVVGPDGRPVHEYCIKQHLAASLRPRSLYTNEPLPNKNIVDNWLGNKMAKALVEKGVYDTFFNSITHNQIDFGNLYSIINSIKRIHDMIDWTNIEKHKIERIFTLIENGLTKDILPLLTTNLVSINTPNERGTPLLVAACVKNLSDVITQLLKIPNIDINCRDKCGNTPLYVACALSNPNLCFQLLNAQGIDPNIPTNDGSTPLMKAISRNLLDICWCLLSIPTIDIHKVNNSGINALLCACDLGNEHLVNHILSFPGTDINHSSKKGETALFLACKKNSLPIVSNLLKIPNISLHGHAYSSIHTACLYNYYEICSELLLHPNIDPNIKNAEGNTPLHITCKNSHTQLSSLFLSHSSINVNKYNNLGESIFHCARSQPDIAIKILNHPTFQPSNSLNIANSPHDLFFRACQMNCKRACTHIFHISGMDPNVIINNISILTLVHTHKINDLVTTILSHPKLDVDDYHIIHDLFNVECITPLIIACRHSLCDIAIDIFRRQRHKNNDCVRKALTIAQANHLTEVVRTIKEHLDTIKPILLKTDVFTTANIYTTIKIKRISEKIKYHKPSKAHSKQKYKNKCAPIMRNCRGR